MNKFEINRTITVNIIKFDDGSEIDVSVIRKFLDDANIVIDTIGKEGNYTDEYLYFVTNEEKKLEQILLQLDVIRKSTAHILYNDKVGKEKYYNEYRYWLSNGFQKFYDEFWSLID